MYGLSHPGPGQGEILLCTDYAVVDRQALVGLSAEVLTKVEALAKAEEE